VAVQVAGVCGGRLKVPVVVQVAGGQWREGRQAGTAGPAVAVAGCLACPVGLSVEWRSLPVSYGSCGGRSVL